MIIGNFPKVDGPKKHIIAYLDMLGTTVRIAQDDDYRHLHHLYSIYNAAVQISANEAQEPFKSRYGKIITKIFSDNIIMAMPLDSDSDTEDVCHLLEFVGIFQNYASVIHDWPVRGGVTIGELFIDEVMVWGKGLVRAYNLEDKIAIFPRIVIDQSVIHMIGGNNGYVKCDADGWFFLDFLNFMEYGDEQGNDNFAMIAKKSFINQLKEIRGQDGNYQERPYQKLQWYKNYLNQWYKEHYSPVEGTVLIDESTLDENEIKPRKDQS